MVKSNGSCFRIMACACGDTASSDELLLRESKSSSDKSRWSFRKRLSGPRVLGKNAILEPESVDYNNDTMEAIPSSFNSAMNECVSEKASIQKNHSKGEFPLGAAQSSTATAVNSEVSAIVARNCTSSDENIQESAGIIIQAAIRGHLGVRKLREVKYLIKLQAAVRGHLVRAHAVGTLRCIRAITKMQAIVRARLARQLHEKVAVIADKTLERNRDDFYLLGKRNFCEGTNYFYSTKKLLSNRFVVNKILAYTPNTRPIYIKCDISKSDAVWKWLERWMTKISSHTEDVNKEAGKSSKLVGNEEKKNGPDNSKASLSELAVASESKGDHNVTSESNLRIRSVDFLSDSCISSVEKDEECDIEIREFSRQSDSFSSHIPVQSALTPQQTDDYSSHKNESKGNTLSHPSKKEHYGPSENEAQKLAIGSRRPCHISSFSSAYQDCAADARIVNHHSLLKKYKESDFSENLPSSDPIIQVASSESGTEISISSTLDSPDRSETECGEIILEIGSIDKHTYDANNCSDNLFIIANKGAESQARKSSKLEEALSSKALDKAPSAQQQNEHRMSISNRGSLPSYMQATKSARAKVHANNSPKSSPDLHDKDNHIKKRHSLPIVNGKQTSSPPKQRFTPKAQQNPKSNGMLDPHTSAERRWQR